MAMAAGPVVTPVASFLSGVPDSIVSCAIIRILSRRPLRRATDYGEANFTDACIADASLNVTIRIEPVPVFALDGGPSCALGKLDEADDGHVQLLRVEPRPSIPSALIIRSQ
jgi:hypothetical protein